MPFFSSSHFWTNFAHSFLKCVLNLGQLFILREKGAHAYFVRRTYPQYLCQRIIWGNSSKKREKWNQQNIFFHAYFSLEFSAKHENVKLLPLIHLTASKCVLLLFLQIILLFSMIVSCRTKKTNFILQKLFNKQFFILNALCILYFHCA